MAHSERISIDVIELFATVNARLAESQDIRRGVRRALEAVSEADRCDHLFLFEFEEETEMLTLNDAVGLSAAEFRRLDAAGNRGPLPAIARSGATESFDQIRDVAGLDHVTDFRADFSLLFAPIAIAGRPFGLLGAAFDGHPSETLRGAFPVIASMIGQAYRVEASIKGERKRLREENDLLRHELKERYDFSHIIGNSNAMRQVYEQVTQVARSNATVLLRGESGTGKEMIARAIHYNSLRSKRPFVAVNCGALPENLIESELFGHEKGAFTGADKARKGRFELAEGGTLFLDEIGEIPPQTQVKLLRVLQEREFQRVGGSETITSNIRLIAATNKDLEAAITEGTFREDIYYRLNVFTIFLPPLRERRSDILLLAEHFLEKYEAEHGKRIRRISTPAIDMLMAYHFPGNVRELENAIERAVLVCDTNVIHGHHLPPTLQTAENTDTVTDLSLEAAVAAFERDMIQDALKSTGGNIVRAADALGSTERIVGYKIKKYGIDPKRFRT